MNSPRSREWPAFAGQDSKAAALVRGVAVLFRA